jgi:molybdenum cofactor biosynthesis enzyme MoaA
MGVRAVNLSLHLDKKRFFEIARRDEFDIVYKPFDILDAGFEVKVKCSDGWKNTEDMAFVELTLKLSCFYSFY